MPLLFEVISHSSQGLLVTLKTPTVWREQAQATFRLQTARASLYLPILPHMKLETYLKQNKI